MAVKFARLPFKAASHFRIRRSHEVCAILFLLGYDVVKFWLFKGFLAGLGIDPKIFLFLDMVTVPPFIMGSARLVNSLAGRVMAWPGILGWGAAVLVSTLLPYAYAALAGGRRFTTGVWILFGCLLILVLANLLRTIRAGVIRERHRR